MKPKSSTSDGATGKARLLVVDDEESVALTVSEVLRLEGYEVEMVLSGEEAIVRLQELQYDLVLTDLHMEGGDGISVLAEVRRSTPLTIAIVLTGFASLESAIAAMRQGAYDYLVKPCIIDDMKHTIQRGLEHRRLMLAEQEARANLEQLNRELERRVEERTSELQQVNEELERANNAKDIFFATLSHELRTPLTPILGWAKLMRSAKADAALIAQGLDAIERNARIANAIDRRPARHLAHSERQAAHRQRAYGFARNSRSGHRDRARQSHERRHRAESRYARRAADSARLARPVAADDLELSVKRRQVY